MNPQQTDGIGLSAAVRLQMLRTSWERFESQLRSMRDKAQVSIQDPSDKVALAFNRKQGEWGLELRILESGKWIHVPFEEAPLEARACAAKLAPRLVEIIRERLEERDGLIMQGNKALAEAITAVDGLVKEGR